MIKNKNNIIIKVINNQPESIDKNYKHIDLIDKIKQYITDVESYNDSYSQWQYLKKIYECLSSRKNLNHKLQYALQLIEPIIMKYGQYDSREAVDIKGEDMFNYDINNDLEF